MNIDIICPLYNAEQYIKSLHESIMMQEMVDINSIHYVVTKGSDKTEDVLRNMNIVYSLIEPKEYSHSLTRELEAKKCTADIIVFISQDIIIKRKDWLYNLTKDISLGDCDAAYSRQISSMNNIEKYTREKNYPTISFYKDKSSIEEMGLNTFFYSDASSAIRRSVFEALNWYDGKVLPTNEDMYIAHKLIQNGYTIKYCADSEVIHSHRFTFRSLYNRYKATGKFFKMESYMNNYGTNTSGAQMAIYILKRIIEDKNGKALMEYVPNMVARFVGMKVGKNDI